MPIPAHKPPIPDPTPTPPPRPRRRAHAARESISCTTCKQTRIRCCASMRVSVFLKAPRSNVQSRFQFQCQFQCQCPHHYLQKQQQQQHQQHINPIRPSPSPSMQAVNQTPHCPRHNPPWPPKDAHRVSVASSDSDSTYSTYSLSTLSSFTYDAPDTHAMQMQMQKKSAGEYHAAPLRGAERARVPGRQRSKEQRKNGVEREGGSDEGDVWGYLGDRIER